MGVDSTHARGVDAMRSGRTNEAPPATEKTPPDDCVGSDLRNSSASLGGAADGTDALCATAAMATATPEQHPEQRRRRKVSFADDQPTDIKARRADRARLRAHGADSGMPNLFLICGFAGFVAVVFAEIVRSPDDRATVKGSGSLLLLLTHTASVVRLCTGFFARCTVIATAAFASCVLIFFGRILQRSRQVRGQKACPPLKGWAAHHALVATVTSSFRTFLATKRADEKLTILRSRRGTNPSNRTSEAKYKERATPLDVSQLCDVIEIDTQKMLMHVEPGVAMDYMTRVAIAHGVVPEVVLEFPGITVGGAVCGGGIESSSHKFGSFVDTVEEMDVLTGDGNLHRNLTRDSEPDLFYALSTSFGTIGVITRVAIRVVRAAPFIHVRYVHTDGVQSATSLMERMSDCGADGGTGSPDFLDSVALSPSSAMIVCGDFANSAPPGVAFKSLRGRRSDDWFFWHITSLSRCLKTTIAPPASMTASVSEYYRSLAGHEEYMLLEDFLFRFDRGAFWMARPGLELFFGKHAYYKDTARAHAGPHFLLRIKYAWLCTTRQLYRMLHQCGDELVARMFIVQDFIMPSRTEACDFVRFSHAETSIWYVVVFAHMLPYMFAEFVCVCVCDDSKMRASVKEDGSICFRGFSSLPFPPCGNLYMTD